MLWKLPELLMDTSPPAMPEDAPIPTDCPLPELVTETLPPPLPEDAEILTVEKLPELSMDTLPPAIPEDAPAPSDAPLPLLTIETSPPPVPLEVLMESIETDAVFSTLAFPDVVVDAEKLPVPPTGPELMTLDVPIVVWAVKVASPAIAPELFTVALPGPVIAFNTRLGCGAVFVQVTSFPVVTHWADAGLKIPIEAVTRIALDANVGNARFSIIELQSNVNASVPIEASICSK